MKRRPSDATRPRGAGSGTADRTTTCTVQTAADRPTLDDSARRAESSRACDGRDESEQMRGPEDVA